MITLTIDGKKVVTEDGTTILEAARKNGIAIPTLCYHEHLLPMQSCRLCLVEVQGYDKPVASCVTPALEGLSVITQSEVLSGMRREFLQLLLSYHPLDCPQCDKGGECRLQDLTYEYGIAHTEYPFKREEEKEAYATPLIRYWENRCVLCARCFRACLEVSGRHAIDIAGNGSGTRVSAVNAADCISCGECLTLCPVGALTERLSPVKKRIWQGERIETTCPHCGFGCRFCLDVFDNRFISKVLTQDPTVEPNGNSLCVRGRFGYDYANSDAILRTPRLSIGGNQRNCDLEEAATVTAAHFKKLNSQGKKIGFVVSARSTNEEIYLVSRIAGFLGDSPVGSPAWYHTGKVQEALKNAGMGRTYRYGALAECDLIVAAGAELLANNHLLANKVRETVKTRGARVIVINPLPSPLARIADACLEIEPGTDACLFNCISGRLINTGTHAPQAKETAGFSDFAAHVQAYGTEHALGFCGIDSGSFEKAYALIEGATRIGVIFGSGISDSDDSLAALLNFCLLKNLHREGAVMPIALQANALGAASIVPNLLPAHEVLFDPALAGLLVFEDNPFSYLNGSMVRESLVKRDFLAACDILPTPLTDLAHVAVPSSPFSQKEGAFLSQDGTVRRLRQATGPVSKGFEFLRLLLHKLGGIRYESPREIAEALVTGGTLDRSGGRLAALRAKERFILPPSPRTARAAVDRPYRLILRDLFISDYLAGRHGAAKGMELVSSDALFISPGDAAALAVENGDLVVLESAEGSCTRSVTIKEGLKQGILEAVLFRERHDLLKLARTPAKVITVSLTKG